ncbi:MAG: AmmeMemoRadiSam system protein B [Magnetococcales bacterium]|nr:AmmeMemoRadiSam system protein B [Magnetococcales bacterium]
MSQSHGRVRPPAVAGLFYPEEADALRGAVRSLLESVPPPIAAPPVALAVPHAGYVYSGLTAAHAYRALPAADPDHPRRVIVLSPSHRVFLEGVSVGDWEAFATPLGEIPLDWEAVERLAQEPDVQRTAAPHRQEHALEVHLPFLQETVGAFRLVPLVHGRIAHQRLAALALLSWRPGDLLIASTDLSHFHPDHEARRLDAQCHQAVLSLDAAAMNQCEACGRTGVSALLEIARERGWRPEKLHDRNSGEVTGDRSSVVGYASYVFHASEEGRA